jgi:hypothetical protein
VSRKRALQVLGGAIAVAVPSRVPQVAEAGKHRNPPQAVVAGALVGAGPSTAGSLTWTFQGTVVLAIGSQIRMDTTIELKATATADQVRKDAVPALRAKAAATLHDRGEDVPEDRIAVTLL